MEEENSFILAVNNRITFFFFFKFFFLLVCQDMSDVCLLISDVFTYTSKFQLLC